MSAELNELDVCSEMGVLKTEYLDKQIASMLIMGFEGLHPTDETINKVASYLHEQLLGGVILFRRNIESATQLNTMIEYFKKAEDNIFIAIDQEGGRVQRLPFDKGFEKFPSAEEVSKKSLSEAKEIYSNLSLVLHNYGINLNFAPVVDINDPEKPCPVIGSLGRSFGANPSDVVEYASVCMQAHHENKVFTAIKHFPGHGLASGDSHLGMVDVTSTAKLEELEPFYKLIERKNIDMIMTAHIINKNLDSMHPATLSPIILKQLLRDKGYDGLIIADDLHMGAIASHYSFEDSIVMAINAGCNLIIFSNNPFACKNIEGFKPDHNLPTKFISVVKKAIADGRLTIDQINESYTKINNLKKKFAL